MAAESSSFLWLSRLPFISFHRQTTLLEGHEGYIELNPKNNFETALTDLEGFDKIWLVFLFHKAADNWKPMVNPPRGNKKRGVFATRSPHRPNPIGITCVNLKRIDGRKIFIEDHDLINETPILDIKPYLPFSDSHPEASAGWIDEVENNKFDLIFSEMAQMKIEFLLDKTVELERLCSSTLQLNPFPSKNNRISETESGYIIAVKTWRLSYKISEKTVIIDDIFSGYTEQYLTGEKESKWDDVPIHQAFIKEFRQ